MINSHQNFVCLVIVSIFLIVYSSAKILSNENRDNTFVLQKAQVRYSEAAFNIIYAECKTNYINFFHFLSFKVRKWLFSFIGLASPKDEAVESRRKYDFADEVLAWRIKLRKERYVVADELV